MSVWNRDFDPGFSFFTIRTPDVNTIGREFESV